MEEEYWLKYGFKENGNFVCLRTIADSRPTKEFFYTDNGEHKEVKNPDVVKLTKEIIEKLSSINNEGV